MKIDIRKAFDTLDWSFLCRVHQAFGFSSVFLDWIDSILHSSRLSVLFNEVPEGYFCCSRGVRQGDPLSPLLFGIVENFLGRLLTRGTQKNLKHIMGAFRDYGDISGQLVNWDWATPIFLFGSPFVSGHLQKPDRGYVTSSIWSSLQTNYSSLLKEGIWLIDENSQRDFWRDNWLRVPILELLGIPDYLANLLRARVSDFIHKGRWVLNDCFLTRFPDLCFRIDRIVISPVVDSLIWANYRDGRVSCKTAYSQFLLDIPPVVWWRDVWSHFIPPSRSALTQRLMLNRLPTEDLLCRSGFQLASRCSICGSAISEANRLDIGCMRNFMDDLLILRRFGLQGRPSKAPVIKSVIWSTPAPSWIKVNTDGAAMGSPGFGGCGGIFRNYRAFMKGCFAIPLGQVFAFRLSY
ncbi:hypothetical protein LWI28_026893 [Acer negundo]|uniref:Reverse transcriptase domain-containing protein n=1 Tax=Acer negundo TaxID=4023 RepID=A0AAD5IJU2_ACENE|nr:hypothetical protein LWI28_026893 [Acer negundo]